MIMTEADYAKVPEMIRDGMTTREIAEHFNTTVGSLRVRCSHRKISLKSVGWRSFKTIESCKYADLIKLDHRTMKVIQQKALAARMTETALIGQLLKTIARDDLFNAVLDNGPETMAA